MGASAGCSPHPLPEGRALALYRDLTAPRPRSTPHIRATARMARVRRPLLDAFDAVRNTMLAGFPPVPGPVQLAGARPARAAGFAGSCRGRRPASAIASSAAQTRGPGCSPERCTATCRPRAGAAIAVAYLYLLGHAVGWPSPRGGARALTDALVATCVPRWPCAARPAPRPTARPRTRVEAGGEQVAAARSSPT